MPHGNLDRTIARTAIAALGIGTALALFPLATGLFGGAVLYVVLKPLHAKLAPRVGRRVSAGLITAASTVALALPGIWLLDVIVDEGPRALRAVTGSTLLRRLAAAEVGGVGLGVEGGQLGGALVGWFSARVIHVVGSGLEGVLHLVIALFGLYYLLVDGPATWSRVVRLLPFSRRSSELLRERFVVITDATLLGTALTAILQGLIVGAAFAMTGLPNPPFWGTVTAIVSVLPVLGSVLVWVPAAIALFAAGDAGRAIGLALVGIVVVSNVDNVVRLMVNRRIARLHPMATLVGAFAGVPVFGIAGVLLGPLAISYLFELLRIYRREYGHAADVSPPVAIPDGAGIGTRERASASRTRMV